MIRRRSILSGAWSGREENCGKLLLNRHKPFNLIDFRAEQDFTHIISGIFMPPIAVTRETALLATEMLALFGHAAADEARSRARHSRNLGNLVNFCHWREAARLICILSSEPETGTIH